jgi:putative DNA primase/helicase
MNVRSEQRASAAHPCPICGGHPGKPRGNGVRCHGFISADGRYAHCTREEYAHGLPLTADSQTYAHCLGGPCRCGFAHGNVAPLAPAPKKQPRIRLDSDFDACTPPYPVDYRNENGEVLYRIARWTRSDGRKSYGYCRPDGPGRWVDGLGEGERVIYRLPEILAALSRGETIHVCEGEKKVELLVKLGFEATCNDGGAGKWRSPHTEGLRGARRVVVWTDQDRSGRAHPEMVARALRDAGSADIRLPLLPGLAEGEGIDDWLERAGANPRQQLEAIVAATAPWVESGAALVPTMRAHGHHATDIGNAARLVDDHGLDLRCVTAWRRWLIWNGSRWAADTTEEITRRAKQTVALIYGEAAQAPESERTKLASHAIRSESQRAIRAMIQLAESELAIKPEILDSDPWLLNVKNGTVDLRTGAIRAPLRADFITKQVPVRFDPKARHPVWEAFLDRMVPDTELRSFLQRAVGYSLTGDTSEEKLFFIFGPTAAGKSTFTAALRALLGDYASVCDFESFLRQRGDAGVRSDIARLVGVRMAISQEVDEARHLAEALVKNLTGGDVLTARHLYQEFFEFRPAFKLWLVANDKPRANPDDDALWRRILLVPFDQSLPEAERDPTIKKTLLNDERACEAILAWAVQGAVQWHSEGLRPPALVRRATDAYREEQDALAPFLSECCVFGPGEFVPSAALKVRYEDWCAANQERPLSQNVVRRRLRDRGCELTKSRDRRTRGWLGLGLQEALIAGPADSTDTTDSSFSNPPYEEDQGEDYENRCPEVSPLSADAESQEFAGVPSVGEPEEVAQTTPPDVDAEPDLEGFAALRLSPNLIRALDERFESPRDGGPA